MTIVPQILLRLICWHQVRSVTTTRTLILAVFQQHEQIFCKTNITSGNHSRKVLTGRDKELVDVGKRLVNCDPLVTPFFEVKRNAERRPVKGGQSSDDKSHVAVDEPSRELLEEVLLLLDFVERLDAAVYSGVDSIQI